jgi:leishmanolysin
MRVASSTTAAAVWATVLIAYVAAHATHVGHAVSSPPVEHECVHDTPALQAAHAGLLSAAPAIQNYHSAAQTEGRVFHAQAARPIRIVFSFDDLTESGAYCTKIGDLVPDYVTANAKITCTLADEVLTDAKRAVLKTNILPAALERIQKFLSVEPIKGNLVVPSTSTCGADFAIPPLHTITGVENADLVMYVAAGPIAGATVAFAGACSKDQNGRAVVGRMNYDAERLVWSSTDTSANQALVDIAVHEIFHVLGVSSTAMSPPNTVTATKRGKTVTMVATPTVVAYVRQFTGCATLQGAEIEDEGGSGSSGSHWERKLYYDEIMCAVVGTKVSGLSLAFLNDINVGYTVTLSIAEGMNWGLATGCGVHDNKCNSAAGGSGTLFCFDDPNAEVKNRCTFDLRSIGTCSVSTYSADLPTVFQYFSNPRYGGPSFMDGCPLVVEYSNRLCSVEKVETSNDVTFGNTYSTTSRCFDASGVIRDGFSSSSTDGPRCLEARCPTSTSVEFRIGSSAYSSCTTEGAVRPAPAGYLGQVTCPKTATMCTSLGVITPAPFTNASSTTNAPGGVTPPPTTTAPPTTSPVTEPSPPARGGLLVEAGIVIQGTSFHLIQADAVAWQNLRAALRLDIAALLALDTSLITITNMQVGSLIVNFTASVTESTSDSAIARINALTSAFNPLPRTMIEYQRVAPNVTSLLITQATASDAVTMYSMLLLTTLVAVLCLWAGF